MFLKKNWAQNSTKNETNLPSTWQKYRRMLNVLSKRKRKAHRLTNLTDMQTSLYVQYINIYTGEQLKLKLKRYCGFSDGSRPVVRWILGVLLIILDLKKKENVMCYVYMCRFMTISHLRWSFCSCCRRQRSSDVSPTLRKGRWWWWRCPPSRTAAPLKKTHIICCLLTFSLCIISLLNCTHAIY